MKLEMRIYDLDVRLEINDDDNFDALEVLQNVKNLLEELKVYDHVNLSVISTPYDDDEPEEDFEMLMAIWRVMAGCTAFVIILYAILKTTTP